MGVCSLPKTVTRQRRDCDLNPGPSAPESSTLTTRLPSHPNDSEGNSKFSSYFTSTTKTVGGNVLASNVRQLISNESLSTA